MYSWCMAKVSSTASGFLRGEWSTTSPVLQRVVAVSVAMREVFSDIYLFSENTHTVCAGLFVPFLRPAALIKDGHLGGII